MRGLIAALASRSSSLKQFVAHEHSILVLRQGYSPSSTVVHRELISLLPLCNQRASYSAYKKPPSDDDEDADENINKATHGHLPRIKSSVLRQHKGVPSDSYQSGSNLLMDEDRQKRIRDLISSAPECDATGAFKFLAQHFGAAGLEASGGKQGYTIMDELAAEAEDATETDAPIEYDEQGFPISTLDPLEEEEEHEILDQLKGLRRGAQRAVLQKLLQGGMMEADPEAEEEYEYIKSFFEPPEDFRFKVVDINRVCKGTRSGGIYRFSAMVVVGNGEGVLGWGQGKAHEVQDATKKAFARACRNLYPIPRYNEHTITEETTSKFGKVKVIMYPKTSGRGIVASTLITDICKLAGIHDIGVKVFGSRNSRNTVRAVFEAFDNMRTWDEILAGVERKKGNLVRKRVMREEKKTRGKHWEKRQMIVLAVPPGKFGRVEL